MRTVLFIITSDPCQSHRPAEAVRIAAGLSAWQKVRPLLYFAGPARLALRDDTADFIDEEIYQRHLGALAETKATVFMAQDSSESISEVKENVTVLTLPELALLAKDSDYVLNF